MPKYLVTMHRYSIQNVVVEIEAPDGQSPLQNLPALDDPNLEWTQTGAIALTPDCRLVPPVVSQPETTTTPNPEPET